MFLKFSQNSSETCNFIKKETLAQVLSCKFYKIFKKTFLDGTPLVAASELSLVLVWSHFLDERPETLIILANISVLPGHKPMYIWILPLLYQEFKHEWNYKILMLKIYPVLQRKLSKYKNSTPQIHNKIKPTLFFQSLSYTKQDKVKSLLYENVQLKTQLYHPLWINYRIGWIKYVTWYWDSYPGKSITL